MVMNRPQPLPSAVLAAFCALLLGLTTTATAAEPPSAIDQARRLMDQGQPAAAAESLENALTTAAPDQQLPLLALLRQAYTAAAQRAAAQGRADLAERFRDNLEILNRGHPVPTQAAPNPPVAPASIPAPTAIPVPVPVPSGGGFALPVESPLRQSQSAAPVPEPPGTVTTPVAAAPPVAVAVAVAVADADAAFRAKNYVEAGRLYAALDREGRLPASRRDHWAYCRCTEVVRRINARPATREEWAEIDAEIQRIRTLSPNNWFGEYLRNRAAERTTPPRSVKSNRLVIRGSAPEEPLARTPRGAAPTSGIRAEAAQHPLPPQPPAGPGQGPGPGQVAWKVRETPSFRILHTDPELADKAAEIAEATRDVLLRRWSGSVPRGPWTPRCDVYLYPSPRSFSQMTGQPEESPGFSTMGMNGGRIIARRVNLRADHPNLLKAILPHEITHVVLADLFPHQQIPRWADEGMAVLSEPVSEQNLRASDLEAPLGTGQLFKVEDLMRMDYPEGKYWGLYYAQSVSLTRFLVEQGSPTQFIQFVQRSQQNNPEAELKRIYNIDGYIELQKRWLAYAQTRTAEKTASAAAPDQESTTAAR
jgi:hypothetical protein